MPARYLDAVTAADGDASVLAGEWVFTSREFCYATGGWWQEDGTFYLPPGHTLYDCFWVDAMTFIPDGHLGELPRIPIPPGGSGPGGAGPHVPSPPDSTAPPADSAAVYMEWFLAETDDTQIPEGVWELTELEAITFDCRKPERRCPKPSAYVTSPAVVSAAAAMVSATAADGLERGAWLFRSPDGSIRVGEWHVGNVWGQIPTMRSDLMPPDAIGMIHSHPQNDPPSGNDAGVARQTGTYSTIATTKYLFLLDPDGAWIYKGPRPIP